MESLRRLKLSVQAKCTFTINVAIFFTKAYSNFGDIIRHTMGKCREIDNKAFARVLLLSLRQEFEKLLDDSEGDIETNSKDFAALKVC